MAQFKFMQVSVNRQLNASGTKSFCFSGADNVSKRVSKQTRTVPAFYKFRLFFALNFFGLCQKYHSEGTRIRVRGINQGLTDRNFSLYARKKTNSLAWQGKTCEF